MHTTMVRIQHLAFPRNPALYHLGRIIGEKPTGGGGHACRCSATWRTGISKCRRREGRSLPEMYRLMQPFQSRRHSFLLPRGAPIISRRAQPSTRFEDEMKNLCRGHQQGLGNGSVSNNTLSMTKRNSRIYSVSLRMPVHVVYYAIHRFIISC